MKTILQLIHSDEPGGAESMVLELLTGLESQGYRCLVGFAGEGWLADRLAERDATVIPLSFRHTGDWRLLREIRKILIEYQVSLIHTHLSRMNLYGGIAGGLAGVPVVATLHGRDFSGRWGLLGERLVSRFSTRVVPVSNDLAQALVNRGWDSERIKVIHNGINPVGCRTQAEYRAIRTELGIKPDTPVIGTVGRLEPVKNYSNLLSAAEQVSNVVSNACFLFVGDGSERESLEREAKQRKIAARVRFLGTRSDARRLVRALDVFVLSSHSEGISISLLEAMDAGVPAVVTEVGGNPEVVEFGVSGLLVPPSDSEMLAAALLYLIGRPQILHKMGVNAHQRVAHCFSMDSMLAGYTALYEELITNHTSRRKPVAVNSENGVVPP